MLSESGASTEPRYSPRLRMMMTHIASMAKTVENAPATPIN
jgi:hypothetical protein